MISTTGAAGTSPAQLCRLAGSRSLAVWLDSSESALCVSPAARTLSSVSSVLACELLSEWKCCREMGGRVSGHGWREQSSSSARIRPRCVAPSGPVPTSHLGVPPPTDSCATTGRLSQYQAGLFPSKLPMRLLHHPGLQVGCERDTQVLFCLISIKSVTSNGWKIPRARAWVRIHVHTLTHTPRPLWEFSPAGLWGQQAARWGAVPPLVTSVPLVCPRPHPAHSLPCVLPLPWKGQFSNHKCRIPLGAFKILI